MIIDISKINSTFSFISPYSIYYQLDASNNLAVNYYPTNIYNQVTIIEIICKFVILTGFLVFAIGMIRGRVISTELMLNLQLGYFGLAIMKYSDPLFYSMETLKYTNGYNINSLFPVSQPTQLPSSLTSMGVYPLLINNVNVMLTIPALFLFVGLIMSIF